MDILLHHGDHERNAQGFLQRADGARESIQQAMIRLSVPQGSFALDKNLGSRLHTLPNAPKERQEELALEYAQEALLGSARGAGWCRPNGRAAKSWSLPSSLRTAARKASSAL